MYFLVTTMWCVISLLHGVLYQSHWSLYYLRTVYLKSLANGQKLELQLELQTILTNFSSTLFV